MKRIAAENPDVLWAKLNGSDPALVPIFQAMGIKKVGGPIYEIFLAGLLMLPGMAHLA
jgi:hypothetical protein